MGYDRMKVIQTAEKEIGYLEKSKSAYQKYGKDVLYDKTKGAGYDNYTKYGYEMHQISPSVMDFPAPYCDGFVDWCFYKTYGIATAKNLLGGNFNDYTVASAQLYKSKNALDNKPEVGAQVFFTRNGQISGCYHTGLVIAVSADKKTITTIEGNTSATSKDVVANGGCVAKKTRTVSNNTLFGHPAYNDGYGTNKSEVNAMYTGVIKLSSSDPTKSWLNVRKTPSGSVCKVGDPAHDFALPSGMQVFIEKEKDGWGKLAGFEGWVSLKYVVKK